MVHYPPSVIRQDYLRLYRAGLQAVQYSKPARYYVRNILRRAFRNSPRSAYEPEKVSNTVTFLKNAALNNGTEHKVVRNIVHMAYWRERRGPPRYNALNKEASQRQVHEIQKQTFQMVDDTIKMLNETANLDLRI